MSDNALGLAASAGWRRPVWISFERHARRTRLQQTARCRPRDTCRHRDPHHFEHSRTAAKTFERLGVKMLLAALGEIQGIAHHLAHLRRQPTQIIMRGTDPEKGVEFRRISHSSICHFWHRNATLELSGCHRISIQRMGQLAFAPSMARSLMPAPMGSLALCWRTSRICPLILL